MDRERRLTQKKCFFGRDAIQRAKHSHYIMARPLRLTERRPLGRGGLAGSGPTPSRRRGFAPAGEGNGNHGNQQRWAQHTTILGNRGGNYPIPPSRTRTTACRTGITDDGALAPFPDWRRPVATRVQVGGLVVGMSSGYRRFRTRAGAGPIGAPVAPRQLGARPCTLVPRFSRCTGPADRAVFALRDAGEPAWSAPQQARSPCAHTAQGGTPVALTDW